MDIQIRAYEKTDVDSLVRIWNTVVETGIAFPQTEMLTESTGGAFFSAQSLTAVAYDSGCGDIVGLYILHPNNVGRCGHICNASYAVKDRMRGQGNRRATCPALHGDGKDFGISHSAIQCSGKKQRAGASFVSKTGVCAAWHDPGRIFDERRTLRGHHSALLCFVEWSGAFIRRTKYIGTANTAKNWKKTAFLPSFQPIEKYFAINVVLPALLHRIGAQRSGQHTFFSRKP